MILRSLSKEDAPFMLEWMHDVTLTGLLPTRFEDMNLNDCLAFIDKSNEPLELNRHYAIVDRITNEYQGTISLKNIDQKNRNAEYAICLRKEAIGQGIAHEATREILHIAFSEIKLNKVYLCVFPENIRATKFYEKFGFIYEGRFRAHIMSKDQTYHDLLWYAITAEEYSDGEY